MCAINVKIHELEFILFNVYMPCDKGAGNPDMQDYNNVLDEISDICNTSSTQLLFNWW